MTREAAERAARLEFGNLTLIEERSREVWQSKFESILADARFALRQLRKAPRFVPICRPELRNLSIAARIVHGALSSARCFVATAMNSSIAE